MWCICCLAPIGGKSREYYRFVSVYPSLYVEHDPLLSQELCSTQPCHPLYTKKRPYPPSSTRLETLLYSGTTILLDRYHHSGAVYSAAKHNALLDLDWARAPDINLPAPDLVIFLDVSAQRAAERGGFGGERYEESEMQSRVRELFRVVGERERMEGRVRWEVVDAGRGVEEVSKEVVELVGQCLEMVQRDGGRPLLRIAR